MNQAITTSAANALSMAAAMLRVNQQQLASRSSLDIGSDTDTTGSLPLDLTTSPTSKKRSTTTADSGISGGSHSNRSSPDHSFKSSPPNSPFVSSPATFLSTAQLLSLSGQTGFTAPLGLNTTALDSASTSLASATNGTRTAPNLLDILNFKLEPASNEKTHKVIPTTPPATPAVSVPALSVSTTPPPVAYANNKSPSIANAASNPMDLLSVMSGPGALDSAALSASLPLTAASLYLQQRKRRSTSTSSSRGDSPDGPPSKKQVNPVPEDQKDDAYWDRRRKNNEAAKRSRDLRRKKEEEIAIRAAYLEQENLKLRAQVALLKNETAKLQYMLYSRV